jgi:hypothetical protein
MRKNKVVWQPTQTLLSNPIRRSAARDAHPGPQPNNLDELEINRACRRSLIRFLHSITWSDSASFDPGETSRASVSDRSTTTSTERPS